MRGFSIGAICALIGLLVACGSFGSAQAENYLCQQQFALCTSAPCIPQPGNPKVAMCMCAVEDGPNLATQPCDTLKPSTDANGIRSLYSQFALKQFAASLKTLKCPSGTPWTWCLNKPCTVDRRTHEGDLRLRRRAHRRVDHRRRKLRCWYLQNRLLVGSSRFRLQRRYRLFAQIDQSYGITGDVLPGCKVRRAVAGAVKTRAAGRIVASLIAGLSIWSAVTKAAEPVRMAFQENFPPFAEVRDGKPTGMTVEIIRAAAGKAGIEVDFVPVPFDQVHLTLKDGRADAIFPLAITLDREALYDFSRPLLMTGAPSSCDLRTRHPRASEH